MSFFFITQLLWASSFHGENDIWADQPTIHGSIIYSIILPIICFLGICANSLSFIILRKKELKGSFYTYLSALAVADFLTLTVLFYTGLSRGFMWQDGWGYYDALIVPPLGGATNCFAVMATVFVTIDRVLYLWKPIRSDKPKCCTSWIARLNMSLSFLVSIIFNLPYCFIYRPDDQGNLITTNFYDSKIYAVFNWIYFLLFTIIPSVILIVGNGFLIKSLKRAKDISKKCKKNVNCIKKKKEKQNLTIILILIIVFFLVTEIPASMLSRSSASNLLYFCCKDISFTTLEVLRQFCAILGALNAANNFILYYWFCTPFRKSLKRAFRCKKRKSFQGKVQVNVFVLNRPCRSDMNKKIGDIINDKGPRRGFTDKSALSVSTSSSFNADSVSREFIYLRDMKHLLNEQFNSYSGHYI